MSNSKKIIMVSIILAIFCVVFVCASSVLATNINMNLANESNVTDNDNPGNNLRNSNATSNLTELDTNTVTSIESIDEYNEPTSSFGISEILNILLLAVGLVIILLAVAILIRLGK